MSYGTNAPTGLVGKYSLTGATWNGQPNQYAIKSGYANSLFSGDPVIRLADGTIGIWPGTNVPVLGVLQSIFYIDNNGNPQPLPCWTGNTVTQNGQDVYALVADDPNIICSIQVSTSSNANQAIAVGVSEKNFGCNISMGIVATANGFAPVTGPGGTYNPPNNPGTGSATNGGISGYYADFSTMTNRTTTPATDGTGNPTGTIAPLKIYGLDPIVNQSGGQVLYSNVNGVVNGVFNNILVTFNNHIYKGGYGTYGTGIVGV